jgi:iron transport multicopper oxidase
VNHVPKTVGGFHVYAGQRYSVVLNANKAVKNYWIRAPMDMQHHSDNDNRKSLLIPSASTNASTYDTPSPSYS